MILFLNPAPELSNGASQGWQELRLRNVLQSYRNVIILLCCLVDEPLSSCFSLTNIQIYQFIKRKITSGVKTLKID